MKLFIKSLLLFAFLFTASTDNSTAQQPKTKVTLGIKLDYFFSGKDGGVRAKGLVPQKTAEKAGVKSNDIILALNETKIKGLFHYRDMLSTFTAGDKVRLKVKRGMQILYLNAQFQ